MPRPRLPLRRALLALAAACACAFAAAESALLAQIDDAGLDDPRAALALSARLLQAAPDPEGRFWALLGEARTQTALEQPDAASAALTQARSLLEDWPGATAGHRRWLTFVELLSGWSDVEPQQAQQRLRVLRNAVEAEAEPLLACEVAHLDMTLLMDIESHDEAWLAAEAAERCGRALGVPRLTAAARMSMGTIAARGRGGSLSDADDHFAQALDALGGRPARMFRSIVAWERGMAERGAERLDSAMEHLETAQALSRELGDSAGIAAANISIASLHLQRGGAARALPLLQEARALLEGRDNGYRLLSAAQYTLEALAALKRPEVLAEITRARQWDQPRMPAGVRARLVHAMAEGYASLGRFGEAYAELRRSEALEREGRQQAKDVQVLRLQARYATAQRDAENAELRHRTEAARLELVARSATQRALSAAVVTLAIVLLGGGAWGWRVLARRRALADLALRDELTGQPNRRAVTAYAQAQFEQSSRLGVPLTVALLDLDHFKRVNDTHGHAGGDAVLRALAQATRGVLRGQDRLGRWGGEEWLLVMPGTSAAELPAVFERLRARFAGTPAEGLAQAHGCTFSMGAAQLEPATPDLQALIAAADRRLYRAKAEGRDRLVAAD